jgi:hypothetical protein
MARATTRTVRMSRATDGIARIDMLSPNCP